MDIRLSTNQCPGKQGAPYAELLAPLGRRIEALVAAQPIVQADETVMRVLHKDKCKKGYLWTFLAWAMIAGRELNLIAFRFSPSRSGETPVAVLGATQGTLVVDAYTGYNAVTNPDGRERAGCMAHVRRKLFDALTKAPEAQRALDIIRELYVVEHEAMEADVVRQPAHLTLRQIKSRPIMERLRAWLDDQKPNHLPKGAMGEAISYALNNWASLCHRRPERDPFPPLSPGPGSELSELAGNWRSRPNGRDHSVAGSGGKGSEMSFPEPLFAT